MRWSARAVLLAAAAAAVPAIAAGRGADAEDAPPLDRATSIATSFRIGLLTGDPRRVHPDAGIGFQVALRWFYRPGLGLLVDGGYDRWGDVRDNGNQLAYATFTAQHVVARPLGERWLPWLGVGGGLLVSTFRRTPEGEPGVESTLRAPLGRACAGVDFAPWPRVSLGLRLEYDRLFGTESAVIPNGPPGAVELQDDTLHAGVAIGYRF